MRPCLSVMGRPSSCVGVRSLCLEIASTAGMIVHAYVQLSTSAAHGSIWAGVQLSKLSAEVHEYEGGLEGARPCVGPQAYVVINCADRRRWALRPRPDRYRHMRQLGYTVGSSWSRAAPRLWTTVEQGLLLPPRLPRAARLIERIGLLT